MSAVIDKSRVDTEPMSRDRARADEKAKRDREEIERERKGLANVDRRQFWCWRLVIVAALGTWFFVGKMLME